MKIGLYFGSFNPIHNGHLTVANQALEFMGLDQVWFMVSPQNPLKPVGSLLNEHLRLEMVRLAVLDNPKFFECDFEFNLPRPSFTLNTLDALADKYSDHQFMFICGHDLVAQMATWQGGKEVLERHPFFVHGRPNAPEITAKPKEMIYFDLVTSSVSSTYVRKLIREGRSIKYLVPNNVIAYIMKNNLYKD